MALQEAYSEEFIMTSADTRGRDGFFSFEPIPALEYKQVKALDRRSLTEESTFVENRASALGGGGNGWEGATNEKRKGTGRRVLGALGWTLMGVANIVEAVFLGLPAFAVSFVFTVIGVVTVIVAGLIGLVPGLDWIQQFLEEYPGGFLLDVGQDTGVFGIRRIAPAVKRFTGTDMIKNRNWEE